LILLETYPCGYLNVVAGRDPFGPACRQKRFKVILKDGYLVIKDAQPESNSSLAEMTGRKPGNLSRTLKTMSNYGIVEMKRENNHVRPSPR